jgi:carboxypeptidase Taq
LDEQFAAGNFVPFNAWLHERVYRHGQRFVAGELIEQATGRPADQGALVTALRAKYGA